MKKRIFVDLDDTLAKYQQAHTLAKQNTGIEFPQSIPNFFLDLEPIEGAIEGVLLLSKKYDVHFLTSPSFMNPLSYTEKRLWIEKHFGLEWCKKLIIAYDKSLLKGDYLIDDSFSKGQLEFEGELIQIGTERFPDWKTIIDYLYDDI
jgi:5'(3')-deoxyribonucleotidase